jgi:Mce-associated membrane protein
MSTAGPAITGLETALTIETDTETTAAGAPPRLTEAATLGGTGTDTGTDSGGGADICDAPDGAGDADCAGGDRDDASAAGDDANVVDRRFSWMRFLAYGLVPFVSLALAGGVGYLRWQDGTARLAREAAVTSVQAAKESTVAMLAYRPDTVEKDLAAAGDRMTGKFRGEYSQLVEAVVVPGAKQKLISSVVTVPAAASVAATENHAVVLVFVNQSIVIGNDPPAATASSVRVTLDKVGGRWLISQFDPV